jgi:hypothetical protein
LYTNGEPVPKSKEKHEKSILYIKAASLNDLCRWVFDFDFTSRSLVYSKGRLIALGESVGETTLAYYVNIEAESRLISYKFPSSAREPETAHFIRQADESNKNVINVIHMDLGWMKEAKKVEKDSISVIRMESPEDIFNATVKRAVREEAFMYAYSFVSGKKRYICGFDLLDELAGEKKTFYYAALSNTSTAGFVRYKYTDNTFEFTDTVEEHSYIYVKIINLAEPFQFFKPD